MTASKFILGILLSVFVLTPVVIPIVDSIGQKKKELDSDLEAARREFELRKSWVIPRDPRGKISFFRHLIKADTSHVFGTRAYRYLGLSYFQIGALDSAEYAWRQGLEIEPGNVYLRQRLHHLFFSAGKYRESVVEACHLADTLSLSEPEFFMDFAEELSEVKEYHLAIEILDCFLQNAKGDTSAIRRMEELQRKLQAEMKE